MKATLKTFGGFAPALLPPPRVVESSRLDAARAHHLGALLAHVKGAESRVHVPDERRYELSIEASGECRTVCCADSTMTPTFADVIAFIEAHGERG